MQLVDPASVCVILQGKAGLAVLGPYVQNGEDLFDGEWARPTQHHKCCCNLCNCVNPK